MSTPEDTIAAFSTQAAADGRMVLRLSGPAALQTACGMLTTKDAGRLRDLQTHRHIDAYIVLPLPMLGVRETRENLIPANVYLMRAPRTYTRQDIVELHLSPAPAIADALLQLACRKGARPAQPGEFTRRAWQSGRLALDQAEAVARLVDAATDAEARAAGERLLGQRRSLLDDLAQRLADLAALLEAALDFSDDDVDVVPPAEARSRLAELAQDIRQLQDAADSEARMLGGARVVLAGRPNAGKSALLNRLAGRGVAIVSHESGTTRDILTEPLQVGPHRLLLTDTAGLESVEPADPIEALARDAAQRSLACADVLLWVCDGSEDVEEHDAKQRTKDVAAFRGTAALLVISKSDLPAQLDAQHLWEVGREAGLPLGDPVYTSARTGNGVDELQRRLKHLLDERPSGSAARFAARLSASEAVALQQAASAVSRALDILEDSAAYELAAMDLRHALAQLQAAGRAGSDMLSDAAEITESLLDRIFSRFCIGK